ncbi:MAG: methionyl-tRNA formyltransferase [FCB group bacterium]|nr:methionyl-tRNA formyltransferase [FCB group bacterium]
MRIVFMGTADFACDTLTALDASHHQIVAVVTVPPRPSGRRLKLRQSPIHQLAVELGYPVLHPESLRDPDFQSLIRDCFADIFVVVAFRILPRSLFSIPPLGAINLHASLLPRYRGAAPVQHALLNNESRTGVTVFQIDKTIDTGNILLQRTLELTPVMTAGDVFAALAPMGSKAILEALTLLENGDVKALPQDDSQACPAPKITSADLRINWSASALSVHNQIRAFSPRPGAYTFYQGKRVKLFDSRVVDEVKVCSNIGRIKESNSVIYIETGKGILEIGSIQLEGKKRLPVGEFLKGRSFQQDAKFE